MKPPLARRAAKSNAPPDGSIQSITAFRNAVADKICLVPIGRLKQNARKSRTHDEGQIAMIMGSFNEFGLINPIIVDEQNVILAGHARIEAAKRLGIETVPIVRVEHLSDAQKRAYTIADNQIATKAGWDLEVLSGELEFLTSIEFNTDLIGFSTAEIDVVIGDVKASAKIDGHDEIDGPVSGPAISRLGDVWLLNKHRVICGSALEPQVLRTLMADRLARMALSDPPFNVAIGGHVSGLGKVKHREFAMASGEMSRTEFTAFLTAAFEQMNAHMVDGALAYTFIDWRNQGSMMAAAETVGWSQQNLCVWDKMTGGMGSLYRSQHELCWIFKKGKSPHINNVELGRHGRYRTNVWQHAGMASFGRGRDDALAMHPTVKPVNLLVEAIKDTSRHGDIILDPFLGSGSTLIAAERSGRVCFGVELDPLYVDTIIRRFEKFTGVQAVHASTGQTFAEVGETRRQTSQTENAAAAEIRVSGDTVGSEALEASRMQNQPIAGAVAHKHTNI